MTRPLTILVFLSLCMQNDNEDFCLWEERECHKMMMAHHKMDWEFQKVCPLFVKNVQFLSLFINEHPILLQAPKILLFMPISNNTKLKLAILL